MIRWYITKPTAAVATAVSSPPLPTTASAASFSGRLVPEHQRESSNRWGHERERERERERGGEREWERAYERVMGWRGSGAKQRSREAVRLSAPNPANILWQSRRRQSWLVCRVQRTPSVRSSPRYRDVQTKSPVSQPCNTQFHLSRYLLVLIQASVTSKTGHVVQHNVPLPDYLRTQSKHNNITRWSLKFHFNFSFLR